MGVISKNTPLSDENFHLPWNQIQNCSDNRSLPQTLSLPSPDSGNSCLTTRKSTRRSEKSSSALKSTNLTQAVSRTTVSGSDTTPEVPVGRCTEKWPLDIELDQVPSRFSEPNRSNLTSADDHKTNKCTTQTSNSHSHDESCPRLPSTPDDSPPNDQTP